MSCCIANCPKSNARSLVIATALVALTCVGCNRSPSVAAQPEDRPTSVASQTIVDPTQVIETTFDDMKFEMEKTDPFQRSMLGDPIEERFGQKIRIRGYMFPTLKKRGLKQFVLVRDNLECCFGPGAALFDCILVHMQPGKTAEFSIRPIAVEGTLRFEEFRDFDGTVRAIYRLDGDAAR